MNIEQLASYSGVAAFLVVLGSWFGFAATFFLRKKPEAAADVKKAPRSWFGLVLQGAGFALVWAIQRRPYFSPIIDGHPMIGIILDIVAVVIAVSSVRLAMGAVKELGKQWSLQARLIEGHKLVTTGVYSTVRHPIYTAMLGMLIATGLVLSHWIGLVAGILVMFIGTSIRTRLEEGLLKDAFGQEFESWKMRVPGLIPFIKN